MYTNALGTTCRPLLNVTFPRSSRALGSCSQTASPPPGAAVRGGGVPAKRTTALTDPVVAGSILVGVRFGGFSLSEQPEHQVPNTPRPMSAAARTSQSVPRLCMRDDNGLGPPTSVGRGRNTSCNP